MKKMAVIILMLLFQFTLVNAQGRMTPKERVKDLKDKLELTDEQAKKVEVIFEESAVKIKEVREKNMGDRAEMMKAMMPINQEQDKKIDSLLTDKQKVKYEEIKKERRERLGRRMAPKD